MATLEQIGNERIQYRIREDEDFLIGSDPTLDVVLPNEDWRYIELRKNSETRTYELEVLSGHPVQVQNPHSFSQTFQGWNNNKDSITPLYNGARIITNGNSREQTVFEFREGPNLQDCQTGRVHYLDKETITIGRDGDIQTRGNRRVSDLHLNLSRQESGSYKVTDRSSNGTLLTTRDGESFNFSLDIGSRILRKGDALWLAPEELNENTIWGYNLSFHEE
ncbi:FHA domain-containing protein [Nanoarchaeota archaeon]